MGKGTKVGNFAIINLYLKDFLKMDINGMDKAKNIRKKN